jgi:two-component system nitrate/nitrite response regulator NarL
MPQIRVAIADDDAGVLSALVDVLAADPRFEVVGAVATGEDLRSLVTEVGPDVVLMDVRMPGGGPVGALALSSTTSGHLRRRPAVVAVSAHTGAVTVATMLRSGAVGYLAKGRLSGLPDLVARCANGEVVLAVPSAAEALRQLLRYDDEAAPLRRSALPAG